MTELREIGDLQGRFRTILAYFDAPVLIVSTNYKTAYVNPAFEKTFSITLHEALGNDLAHFLAPSLVDLLVSGGEKAKEKRGPVRLGFGEGGRYFSVAVNPIIDEQDRITGIVYSFTDLTKEKQLERVKAEFISMLLNDIHSPLRELQNSFLELDKVIKDDSRKKLVKDSIDKTREVIGHLEKLLYITDSISGELRLSLVDCDISTLLANAVGSIQGKAKTEGVILHYFFNSLPLVKADTDKLLQVLIHLISKAVNFAGAGKTVVVGAGVDSKSNPTKIYISVAQTRKAFSADDMPEIFEEDEVPSACDPGCIAVNRIIKAHHAKLSVLQDTEGLGGAMILELPV